MKSSLGSDVYSFAPGVRFALAGGDRLNKIGVTLMNVSRRRFLTRTSACLGITAVASLLANEPVPGVLRRLHFAPKAKNVIFLFMGGGPSHVDTFDPKPILRRQHGEQMPASVLGSQRVTLMTRNQGHF